MTRKATPPAAPRCQTWQERLNDADKAPLAAAFVESLVLTAHANKKTVDDLWVMWREYERTCEGYDQSGTFREFLAWNKLEGRGPLA